MRYLAQLQPQLYGKIHACTSSVSQSVAHLLFLTRESPRAWTPDPYTALEASKSNSLDVSTSTPYDFVNKDQPPMYSSSSNSESLLGIISRFPDAGHIIPQKRYRPNTQSDRRRYVDEIILEPPIVFYAAHGDTTCGIRCSDALSSRFSALHGRDDPMFVQHGPSVSIRIMVRVSAD